MIVLKFGGTSVKDAESMHRVLSIIRNRLDRNPLVVVSALSGVTDNLIHCAEAAHQGREQAAKERFDAEIVSLHRNLVNTLIHDPEQRALLWGEMESNLEEIRLLFHGLSILGELTPRSLDAVVSYGERLSTIILAGFLSENGIPARWLDVRQVLITDDLYNKANPLMDISRVRANEIIVPLLGQGNAVVTQGFIGASREGHTTTLGRGGSDYSAAILGALLDADEIEIWTDVSGVMTADPRVVPEARTILELSYIEASELSYFGAKVLHPKTIWPAVEKNIPIRILNTFQPEHPGTRIVKEPKENGTSVKAITAIKNLCIITVEGRGMQGVPGVAARVFSAVARESVNLLMITQSSSEQSISFVIEQDASNRTIRALEDAFDIEIARHQIDRVDSQNGVVIVAAVGAGMKGTPGIAAKVFGALATARINVISIAQGSSEYNLSFVVLNKDADDAVRQIHREFQLGHSA